MHQSILTFDLIQQSPMIHFQHKEDEACIRCSEVKPKLDRYIREKFKFECEQDKNEKEWHWFMLTENGRECIDAWFLKRSDKSDTALNYKMTITAAKRPKKIEPYSLYYGNMGCSNEEKVKMISGDAKLRIVCFVEPLRSLLEREIPLFFVLHNFGRMQDKGFGSYIVSGTDFNIGKCLRDYYGAEKCYKLEYTSKMHNDFVRAESFSESKREQQGRPVRNKKSGWSFEQYVFEDIKTVYSLMKSGRNYPYSRGIIFQYFYDKHQIRNEKKQMKIDETSPDIKKSSTVIPNDSRPVNDTRYVRAVLGVGDFIDYIHELNGADKPVTDSNRKIIKERVTISNDEIVRMESPILFKIHKGENKYTVYLVARRLDEAIYDKEFVFYNEVTKKSSTIKTPTEFNIDDFMVYFVNKYNEKNTITKIVEVN